MGGRRGPHPLLRPTSAAAACVAACIGWIAGCGDGSPSGLDVDSGTERALRSITAAELAGHVRAVAHDSMGGRATPSAGLEAAGRYVRDRFVVAGLAPAVGGSWDQAFEVFLPTPGTGLNVVGWLEGSDPALRSEYVVVSAHMDHLGTGPSVGGDSIFNGADDNASGTAALLELAEALAGLDEPPARSVVFAAFGGEELGLVGSTYYAENPPFPIASTVASLNMDMIGRNAPDSVAVLRSSPAIGMVVDAVAARNPGLGLAVAADPWPEESLLRRSDQWSFIRSGVAGLLVTSGLHADYHTRDDEVERIDIDKLERVARLVLLILLDLAGPDAWTP